jgi:hypothetical protein
MEKSFGVCMAFANLVGLKRAYLRSSLIICVYPLQKICLSNFASRASREMVG